MQISQVTVRRLLGYRYLFGIKNVTLKRSSSAVLKLAGFNPVIRMGYGLECNVHSDPLLPTVRPLALQVIEHTYHICKSPKRQ